MTKVSIITINFNNAEGLLKTFKSVSEQSFLDFEYIVIDGGSTDRSLQYIKENASSIDYWVSEPDRGIYHAMNKGIAMAKGEYCLFLNSGDTLNNKDALYDISNELTGQNFIIGRVRYLNTGLLSDFPLNLTMRFFFAKSIPHPATFIKRVVFDELLYDESLRIVSDWKLFVEAIILRNSSYKNVNILVSDFDASGVSSINKQLVEKERYIVLKSILPPRIYEDYVAFISGEGYMLTSYDRFFIKLRDYKYGKIIYTLSVSIMKFISLFRSGALFAKNYPIFLPESENHQ